MNRTTKPKSKLHIIICGICLVIVTSSFATESQQSLLDAGTLRQEDVAHNAPDYSPFVDRHVPDKVLWGDTHLHTSYSVDSGFFGNTLGPETAYRFARGEEVVSSTGQRIKLIRPLDWLVVADHAEYFGLADMLANGDPVIREDPTTARWYKLRHGTKMDGMQAFYEVVESVTKGTSLVENPAIQRTAWDKTIGYAEQYNEPGVFTSLIGYEWSSAPNGNNLHRVVMFRDGADRVKQTTPFSTFDSIDPEDLWASMQAYKAVASGVPLAFYAYRCARPVFSKQSLGRQRPVS